MFCCTCISGLTVKADEADRFFTDSTVQEIHITFESSNWYNTLYSAYAGGNDELYLPCRWEFIDSTGTVTVDPVGARFKGHSSFYDSGIKKSLKIDFNEMDPELTFLGMKKLNLNNNFRDPTMLREKLFLDFVSERAPAHRAAFVRVIINGELWGLFTATEQVDKTFCQRMFGDDEAGNLFKGENQADLTDHGDDPASYYDYYELKTNEDENDWTDLVTFIDNLNNTSNEDLPVVLPDIIDYDTLMQHLAANILLINLDSYVGPAHNFYMYHRDDNGRFVHLIWDCNMAFGTYTQPFPAGYNMVELPILWSSSSGNGRPLAERVWDSPALIRDYYRAMAGMLRNGFDSATMDPRIDELADLIRTDVYNDTKKDYTNEEFEQALATDVGEAVGLKRFVADRRTFVRSALNDLALPGDVRLNELMTVNTGTLADGSGDYDPWIEIMNLGPGSVNLTGLYLTNDVADPEKWPLPSISVDDAAYHVLWLDGEPSEGSDHAGFRPETGGGTLYLYYIHDSEQELVDSVPYPALIADTAWGRWPDGTGDWIVLHSPTPGSYNSNSIPSGARLHINEFVASNDTGYRDEAGEYEDWLEIVNTGTEAVNLGGLYLTDTLTNPAKWSLPSEMLSPGSTVVFICDEDQEQGDRHTNFKLSKDGESIGLFSYDGTTVLDSIMYPEQSTNVSYGRCPDGGANWQFMTGGTPGTSNNAACADADGMTLSMMDTDLQTGDRFYLHFVLNSFDIARNMDAYVLLSVGNQYWFWPSWVSLETGIDYQTFDLQAGDTLNVDVLDFDWPQVGGIATGLFFYGAAFTESSFDLIGDVQVIEFGYR